ncbi:hypothetical protein Tco_0810118 [Tanacetum coccineum]
MRHFLAVVLEGEECSGAEYWRDANAITIDRGVAIVDGPSARAHYSVYVYIVGCLYDALDLFRFGFFIIGWKWRVLRTLLMRVIHGEDGKNGSGIQGWLQVYLAKHFKEVETLKIKGIHLNNFMQKKLGNCADTYFWEDLWHGDMVLKQRYPRLYALEVKKALFDVASNCTGGRCLGDVNGCGVLFSSWLLESGRWYWTLDGSGEFSVASARKVIDDNRFPDRSTLNRWINAICQIKVNIHGASVTESSSHLFFHCLVAKDNFRKICRWWEVDFMEVHTFDEWVFSDVNLRGLGTMVADPFLWRNTTTRAIAARQFEDSRKKRAFRKKTK